MTGTNFINRVAITGAGGNVGKFMTEALLNTGKHTVTALTRLDSQSKLPEGVVVKNVDYNNQATVVDALRGQDALVITLGGGALNVERALIEAAAEAGVPWILPNEWSPDSAHEGILKDVHMFQKKVAAREAIEELGKSSYISVVTGFWYEWMLAVAPAFGFDFAKREVTFFDDGEQNISVSTWPQVGRAVASLLSMPIVPTGPDDSFCLSGLRNKVVYVNSFTVSQRDMLASVLRVTNTQMSDWKVMKEPAQKRFEDGMKESQQGERIGFVKFMSTRMFFSDGCGDFEHNRGTINGLLALPRENIDEFTSVAIERSKVPGWIDGH